MRVIYNGVDLFALDTHEFSAEPVYDDSGTDYLYTRFSIYVTAIVAGLVEIRDVNGPQMSYKFTEGITGGRARVNRPPSGATGRLVAGGGDGIALAPGTTAPRGVEFVPSTVPVTHQAVRHRLSSPRGRLHVFAGGGFEVRNPVRGTEAPKPPDAELILSSPFEGYDVDAKNGPTPKKFEVVAATGDAQTFWAEFAIETYVNEAYENNNRPFGPLLSNRWQQTHAVDDDGYSTLATEGLAIFRTDFVYNLNTSPDVDRPILFMPIMQGFRRVIDYVQAREDVTGIAYRYTDTQVPVNFVAGPFVGASRISAVHRQSVTSAMDPLGTAAKMVDGAIRTVERAISNAANLSLAGGTVGKVAKLMGMGKPAPPPVMDMSKLGAFGS